MNMGKLRIRNIPLVMFLILIIGCAPPPTGEPPVEVEVTTITENNLVTGEITQSKIFNQCDAASPLKVQIQFSDSISETNQQELVLSGGVTGGANVSGVAKVELQGSIQKHFSSITSVGASHQESIDIEVLAHTRQEYTITWKETRREGTVEYTENGETKFADYSYRIGLELASSSVEDIECPLSTETPLPATVMPPPVSVESTPIPTRTLADGCIFSQTWSIDQNMLNSIQVDSNGCYSMETLGIFADKQGVLHLFKRDKKNPEASGIYVPINDNYSVVEFKIYVNSMYIVYPERPTYVTFAIAPANAPMSARDSARFNLHVLSTENEPSVLFVLADAGEYNGTQLGTQHYEYTRTYTIRFELQGGLMDIYINDIKLNESLAIPDESKVFYVGYNLPLLAGVDVEVTDIRVDGVLK